MLAIAPSAPVIGATIALNAWSFGYLLLTSRPWLPLADAVVVGAVCLTQQWTVPQEALHGSTSWVGAVVSIAVATWQWQADVRAGAVATVVAAGAYVAGSAMAPVSWVVALWLVLEAVLSRALYLLVRAGAREADRIMTAAASARRDAVVAAARRAGEREHLATMHDTAAAVLLAIGTGVVDGREPWLATQLADALDDATGSETTRGGRTDLVPLLGDVVDHSPVTADLSATGSAPVPAAVAVAICRAVREALLNVARHAGADRARVRLEHRESGVAVEVADSGRGFEPAAVPAHRHGIALSLVDRMAAVGGRADVTSSAGLGTLVRLEWPDG
jgi:signal transduction histidine kinase